MVIAVLVLVLTSPAHAELAAVKQQQLAQAQIELPDNVKRDARDPNFWRNLREGGHGKSAVPGQPTSLIQASGEHWRAFREELLTLYGAWGLASVCAALALFFTLRGRVRIEAGFSERSILRFGGFERFAHWLLAASFLILAVTGLNMLYGSEVVKPLIGYGAFAKLTGYGKWLHDFTGYAFMLGLLLILLLWARDNLPTHRDFDWVAKGGGLFSRGVHPPAYRFNAGQKVIFWFVVLAGALMSVSGISLIIPFSFMPFGDIFDTLNLLGLGLPSDLSGNQEMQLTHAFHAVLGIIMTIVIIAHIYVGSVGMEGALDAMTSGYVDENWAREHHSLWAANRCPDASGEQSEHGGRVTPAAATDYDPAGRGNQVT